MDYLLETSTCSFLIYLGGYGFLFQNQDETVLNVFTILTQLLMQNGN